MVAEAKQYAAAENRGDMFCAVKIGVIERYGYKEKPCCAEGTEKGVFFINERHTFFSCVSKNQG